MLNKTSSADELKKELHQNSVKSKVAGPKMLSFANLDAVREYITAKVGPIEAEHVYMGVDGDTVQIVFRCMTADGKTIRPVHLTDAGYCLGAAAKPWPLYRLGDIAGAETVIVVEGEKCCDVLTRYGFKAVTSAGGSKNAASADWTPLAGKSVILWPDNDADGRRYLNDVEGILQELHPTPRLSIIDPASLDLGEAEDVADFVQQLRVLQKSDAEITTAIADALKTAKTLSIAGEVRQRIADIRAGRYAAILWPWDLLHSLTKALLPGAVTLLAGSGGATKTFMVLQAFIFWMLRGLRVALFEAEEDRTFHLTRALAQQSGCGWLTDPDEVRTRADEADAIAQEHATFLDSFGRILHTTPDTQPTLEQFANWTEEQAKKGCRVIAIDPVTIAAKTGDVWVADAKFLQAVKRTATDFGASILLVTHPVKNLTYPDLTQLAGAACYQRFAQTILWLEHHEAKTSRVRAACGTTEIGHNKTLYVLKARNGRGGGLKLAFQFDAESLTLRELGLIVGKKKD
jgi:5S rRNA maturation endonuclease (ribonuclease M5)